MRPLRLLLLLLATVLLAPACAPRGPRAIDYGHEACDFCRMTISDPRYGAELQTAKGRQHVFDSIECLASYAAQQAAGDVRAVWVSDYAHPGTLVPADSARFYRLTGPGSPMGKGLVAVRDGEDPPPAGAADPGHPMTWADVRALVAREGLAQGSGSHEAAHAH